MEVYIYIYRFLLSFNYNGVDSSEWDLRNNIHGCGDVDIFKRN